MHRYLVSVLVAWLALLGLGGCKKGAQEKEAIMSCMYRLDDSINGKDPEGVIACYTAGTIERYDQLVQMAYSYSKEQLMLRPAWDVQEVLLVRQLALTKKRKFADGKEYIREVVKAGWWVGLEDDAWSQSVGEIRVSGDTAYGVIQGSRSRRGVREMRFVREGGQWKFDETSVRDYESAWIQFNAKGDGKTVDAYLQESVEEITKAKLDKRKIWQPLTGS